jgi:NO-binding membrane sensor protein with MHYT domain
LVAGCFLATAAYPGLLSYQQLGKTVYEQPLLSAGEVVQLQVTTIALLIEFMAFKQILTNWSHDEAYLRYQGELAAAVAIQGMRPGGG